MHERPTETDYPRDQCVHELFEAQAARTPDAIAVVHEDAQLTYAQLNAKANQLAHHLRTLGVMPDARVAICIERSLDMVVGLLAILKAGGAYVPLDPAYPVERLAYMLEDSAPVALLAGVGAKTVLARLTDGLPVPNLPVIDLAADATLWANRPESNPDRVSVGLTALHLAYVIYTSGSTGKPKGVMIEHENIVNHMAWMAGTWPLDPGDAVLQRTPISFDASVWELCAPLLQGARLVLASPNAQRDPRVLIEDIVKSGVTVAQFVPSLLRAFVADERHVECTSLRVIRCGGEVLSADLCLRVRASLGIRVANLYGPTEATINAAAWTCPADEDDYPPSIPIGRPISNTRIYILDGHGEPVPIGVAGEIYIGGAGVARGYLNRPKLTAERFVADPFAGEADARMYKSGDLGRYLPDGTIEFLGRNDFQVKIRGFRIEPGEIEARLTQHPAVREAVVLAREDGPGDKRLVAYYTVAPDAEAADAEALRRHLSAALPDYMVPAAYVRLDALPLSANGKLDRKALPAPDGAAYAVRGYEAPVGEIEMHLARIWAEVLKLERVGRHGNFFELGGHSLLAMRMINEVRSTLGIELPIRVLFEASTVAELAVHLQGNETVQVPLVPKSRPERLPLSYSQQSLWFIDRLEGTSEEYNMPQAWRLHGELDVAALERAINALVERHESLRSRFVEMRGEALQVIEPPARFPLEVDNLTELDEVSRQAAVDRASEREREEPFDLRRGPLLRTKLLKLREREYLLLRTCHHIVSDAWSDGVFNRELAVLYAAFRAGREHSLKPLPVQYADFALWQRDWLQGDVLQLQLDYWKTQLADLPVLDLPTDWPRPTVPSHRGDQTHCVLPENLTASLRKVSGAVGTTLFMTLLAAFQILLHRHSGQDDIAVGTPIVSRNHSQLEGVIGFFLNTLVLRIDVSGNPTFRELLARVRKVALEAYSHQDLPFDRLVQALQPKRCLNRPPLFDVLINSIEGTGTVLELEGLESRPLPQKTTKAKFALSLYISERERDIEFHLVYQCSVFSSMRMEALLDQYKYILEQIVAAPERRLSQYSLVTPRSRALLPDLTAVIPEPPQLPITEQFLAWVAQAPMQAAVCQGDRRWTYEELATRAFELADQLQARGIARGMVVGIAGPRSFGTVTSILAVLMAGGVFVTIDSHLPPARQQVILRESAATALCCVGAAPLGTEWAEAGSESLVFLIYADTGAMADCRPVAIPGGGRSVTIHGGDAAYIFFTSGSTGVPKGILGCHKGLSHFVSWQRQTFNIGPTDRVAQLTGLSFDVFLRDVFLPLTSGATVCLPEESDVLDVPRWLERQRITVAHTTPTLLRDWLSQELEAIHLPDLRWLFVAGEPFPSVLVQQWRKAIPHTGQLVNLYGPTETTLAKCFYVIPPEIYPGIQPVGSVLPNTQALVLGPDAELCGIGEAGEIVLRTPFRTLGYLHLPEENRERFRRNLHGRDDTDLLYFTGDQGRYRPDGLLEVTGRLDDQVKIRGVRVEPAEVTAVLLQHEGVRRGIVVAVCNPEGRHELVAFVVADPKESVNAQQLRAHFMDQLPPAAVPAMFMFLDDLPRLPNGKIDRRALPCPKSLWQDSNEAYTPPRNDVELQLTKIWREVLGLERIGALDDFFELGGDSLKAVRVISRLRQALGVEMALAELFVRPVLAEFAEAVREGARSTLPPILD